MMADVSLVKEAIVIMFKKNGGFQDQRKWLLSLPRLIYHLLPQKLYVMDLIWKLCEIQGITFSLFESIKLTANKKSWKLIIF